MKPMVYSGSAIDRRAAIYHERERDIGSFKARKDVQRGSVIARLRARYEEHYG